MDKKLKRLFDELNSTYWGGKLPPIEIIRSTQLDGDLGEYIFPKSKDKDVPESYRIKIARNLYKKKEVRDTLLHEMCHHSCFIENKEKYWKKRLSWHGVYWKKEMLRVGFGPKITKYT